jgi:type II secretory pathway pseudopilin PulG
MTACGAASSRSGTDERGTTILEVLISVGIILIALGGSVLGLNRTFADLTSAGQTFANDLRLARMNAVTRGAHYRVSWGDTSYRTERLIDLDGNGIWELDPQAPPVLRRLPAGISLGNLGADGNAFEFDTRGMVVPPSSATPDVVALAVGETGNPALAIRIEVWPSGQVYLASGGDPS